MTRAKDAVGAYGERVAARLLHDAGMRVLDRNWRCPLGELDLVARDHTGILIFCEVKTRRGERFGPPAGAVTARKARRLHALAIAWLKAHPDERGEIRFDVVSVWAKRAGAATVVHLKGIF